MVSKNNKIEHFIAYPSMQQMALLGKSHKDLTILTNLRKEHMLATWDAQAARHNYKLLRWMISKFELVPEYSEFVKRNQLYLATLLPYDMLINSTSTALIPRLEEEVKIEFEIGFMLASSLLIIYAMGFIHWIDDEEPRMTLFSVDLDNYHCTSRSDLASAVLNTMIKEFDKFHISSQSMKVISSLVATKHVFVHTVRDFSLGVEDSNAILEQLEEVSIEHNVPSMNEPTQEMMDIFEADYRRIVAEMPIPSNPVETAKEDVITSTEDIERDNSFAIPGL
jgi:hypothetical protein